MGRPVFNSLLRHELRFCGHAVGNLDDMGLVMLSLFVVQLAANLTSHPKQH